MSVITLRGQLRRAALALAGLLWLPVAHAQAAAPSPALSPSDAAAYTMEPRMSGFTVSPGNTHAAFRLRMDSGFKGLAVVELARPDNVKLIKSYGNADVTQVMWVNDRRLAFSAFQRGHLIEDGGAGSFAIDLDGSNERQLIDWRGFTVSTSRLNERLLSYEWFLWKPLDDGSDDVIVARQDMRNTIGARSDSTIGRLNTRTGAFRGLSYGQPDGTYGWVLDAAGELRLALSSQGGRTRLHARPPGSTEWQVLQDEPENNAAQLHPIYMEGGEQLLVSSRQGADTHALYLYDLKRRKLDAEPLLAVKGYDLHGSVQVDGRARRVVGFHTLVDAPLSVWFDERLSGVQAAVDRALPGRFNRLLCGRCLSASHFVVASGSDRVQAEYFIYDSQAGRMTAMGSARPWLPEATQGRRSFHRVPARDGLAMPVVVTHPAGKAEKTPLPAVLLVHGGPWVRGTSRSWSDEAQFLAAQGWRVIEADFRGSTGLGWRHFSAGWRQFGLAMQDDLADVLDWAARENLIDPAKVCITGASYGGYAALMGPVRHPGRYRCAASFAGVTDITLLFSGLWTDIDGEARRHTLPEMIGDPERDAERLRQTSPLHRVAEIKVPLLVGYGALDQRVDKAHALRFLSAARAAGVRVEEAAYAQEGHGFSLDENEADWYRRLARFITGAFAAPAP